MSDQYNRDSMELLAPYDFSDATERGNAEDAVAARLREMGRQITMLTLAEQEVKVEYDKAEEERYQEADAWCREASRWRSEGDMYGWNFHQGMAAGANWAGLFFRRVGRALAEKEAK